MTTRKPAFKASPTNPAIEEIQTIPERRKDMPYAPAMRVSAPSDLLFISGATPSPLYHKHPHELHEHNHPVSIKDQTRNAMETIKSILDHQGLTWTDVIKVTKYLTDMRDMDGMVEVLGEYFGDWTPARRSNRSAFITLVQAATKSATNFSWPSAQA
jgi:2-iminobutanoate/2-iminopropanoate deaminase